MKIQCSEFSLGAFVSDVDLTKLNDEQFELIEDTFSTRRGCDL